MQFRKGLKGLTNEATEQRFDAIIRLFQCLHSKDIFIKAYTKFLAARLLNKTSISNEAEELMLQKLKVECGHNTVNKMTKMFTDMNLSVDLMKEFKQKHNDGIVNGIQMNVEVLTNGFWPEGQKSKCVLPIQLQNVATKFEAFYKNKHQNRNLTWLFQNGSVEVTPLYATQKRYNFVVNVYQACVLNQFNLSDQMTFDEVKRATNIGDAELNPALVFLVNPKVKVLKKANMKSPKFTGDELITLNLDFQNANIKLNLAPVQATKVTNEKADEAKKNDDKEIKMERQNITDATIVRIMKARKTEMF